MMSIAGRLASGEVGIQLAMPSRFEKQQDNADTAVFVDRDNEVVWHLFLDERLTLDLSDEGAASLERDVRFHTEHLREVMERNAPDFDGTLSPRHPLLAYERVAIDGKPGLFVLHRMSLKPGNEVVMGHLLVPLGRGLFEARWLTKDHMTGLRESMLLNDELAMLGDVGDEAALQQTASSIDYDDPRHDEKFPKHALSRARAAGRWITKEADIRVREPASATPPRNVELPKQGCTLTLPPRYVSSTTNNDNAFFARSTLAVNDGVETLDILRLQHADEQLAALCKAVIAEHGGKVKGTLERKTSAPVHGMVVCDGLVGAQPIRVAAVSWSLPQGGTPLVALVHTTPSRPELLLEEELTTLARSARAIEGWTEPKPKKPWWKIW